MNEFYERLQAAIKTSAWVNLVKRQHLQLLRAEPVAYSITLGPIVNGGFATGDIKFEANSDFAWMFSAYHAFDTVTSSTSSPGSVTVLLTDRNTGQDFMNEAVQLHNIFGFAGYPYILPVPRVFQPATRLGVRVNAVALTANNLTTFQFTFMGARLFYGE